MSHCVVLAGDAGDPELGWLLDEGAGPAKKRGRQLGRPQA